MIFQVVKSNRSERPDTKTKTLKICIDNFYGIKIYNCKPFDIFSKGEPLYSHKNESQLPRRDFKIGF